MIRQRSRGKEKKEKTKERPFNLSLIVSKCAFINSTGSLYFSYYTYDQSNKEKLFIQSGPTALDYPSKVSFIISVVTTQWGIVLSNNGDKALSIIQYQLSKTNKDEIITWWGTIDQGIYDENGNRISLPIDIDAGKSRKIILKLGLWLNTKKGCILKSAGLINKPTTIDVIRDTLYKHQTDFLGNVVWATFYHDTLLTTISPKKPKQDIYGVSIITSKKSLFYHQMHWYSEDMEPLKH